MLKIDQAWQIINDLNEEAHREFYDLWEDADKLENNSQSEKEFSRSQEMKEEASSKQSKLFRILFAQLSSVQKLNILSCAKNDCSLKEQLEDWYGLDFKCINNDQI